MGPLIDTELERVDRKHAQLTQLSSDLVEALSLYHMLMREPQLPSVNKPMYGYLSTTSMVSHYFAPMSSCAHYSLVARLNIYPIL